MMPFLVVNLITANHNNNSFNLFISRPIKSLILGIKRVFEHKLSALSFISFILETVHR